MSHDVPVRCFRVDAEWGSMNQASERDGQAGGIVAISPALRGAQGQLLLPPRQTSPSGEAGLGNLPDGHEEFLQAPEG